MERIDDLPPLKRADVINKLHAQLMKDGLKASIRANPKLPQYLHKARKRLQSEMRGDNENNGCYLNLYRSLCDVYLYILECTEPMTDHDRNVLQSFASKELTLLMNERNGMFDDTLMEMMATIGVSRSHVMSALATVASRHTMRAARLGTEGQRVKSVYDEHVTWSCEDLNNNLQRYQSLRTAPVKKSRVSYTQLAMDGCRQRASNAFESSNSTVPAVEDCLFGFGGGWHADAVMYDRELFLDEMLKLSENILVIVSEALDDGDVDMFDTVILDRVKESEIYVILENEPIFYVDCVCVLRRLMCEFGLKCAWIRLLRVLTVCLLHNDHTRDLSFVMSRLGIRERESTKERAKESGDERERKRVERHMLEMKRVSEKEKEEERLVWERANRVVHDLLSTLLTREEE